MVLMRICIAMRISAPSNTRHRLRLLQLVSPSLPIGAFTYSQGLEWAVENGWVTNAEELSGWLTDAMRTGICYLEIPLFQRLYQAFALGQLENASGWIDYLLASRETNELRQEEHQRGRAFARLLPDLGCDLTPEVTRLVQRTQLAGFACSRIFGK